MRLHFSPINAVLVFIAFGWLLLFAHNGLWAQFSGDDLTNLHGYLSRSPASLIVDNLRYWSTSYRPLGGLFYVALYRLFGFNPLPFRVVCFGLLALNLGLLWRFTLRLSGSREVAFLALLLAGFHAWFVDLYYSTGTVYDLLCYSFYLGAFNLYLGVRAQGLALATRHLGMLTALYVCALNAKEMAVSLPVLLAAYEVIYHGRALRESGRHWPWREGRGVLVTGLLTLPYVIGKLTAGGSLTENPAYRLTISPSHYLHTFHLYLNPLLYQEHVFRDANTIQLLLAMLGIALWQRSRPLMFAWCFLLVSLLPIAFMAHYAAFSPVPPDDWLVTLWGRAAGNGPHASGESACPSGETPGRAGSDRIRGRAAPCAFVVPSPTPPAGEREDAPQLRKLSAAFAAARRGTDCPAADSAPRSAGAVHRPAVRQARILSAVPNAPAVPGPKHHGRGGACWPGPADRARPLRRGVHVPARSFGGRNWAW